MSSARDVSPIHWTDYTRGSERGHAEGVPIASQRSSSSWRGTLNNPIDPKLLKSSLPIYIST